MFIISKQFNGTINHHYLPKTVKLFKPLFETNNIKFFPLNIIEFFVVKSEKSFSGSRRKKNIYCFKSNLFYGIT